LGGACDSALYFGGKPVAALGELVAVTLTPDVGVYVWKEMGAEVLALLLESGTVFVLVLLIVLLLEELGGIAKVLAGPVL